MNKGDNRMEGIFSKIVTDMIFTACGLCPGHGSSTIIEITTNGKGDSSGKKSISEVLDDIDDIPQISFPIYGNKYITRYLGAYAYINLVDSPGVAFIAAKSLPGSAAKNMINAVVECIPMIILSACMAYISGFIIWVLVSNYLYHSRIFQYEWRTFSDFLYLHSLNAYICMLFTFLLKKKKENTKHKTQNKLSRNSTIINNSLSCINPLSSNNIPFPKL